MSRRIVLVLIVICGAFVAMRSMTSEDPTQVSPPLVPTGGAEPGSATHYDGDAVDSVERGQEVISSVHPLNRTYSSADPGSQEVDPERAMKMRLYVDGISRADNPVEYEETIQALAKSSIKKAVMAGSTWRSVAFAGFDSYDSMNKKLLQLESQDPSGALMLQDLIDESIRLSGIVEDYALQILDNPLHMDEYDPTTQNDRTAWLDMRRTEKPGLCRFTSSTRVGDRRFDLHFDSIYFPALESELEVLREDKAHFWTYLEAQGE